MSSIKSILLLHLIIFTVSIRMKTNQFVKQRYENVLQQSKKISFDVKSQTETLLSSIIKLGTNEKQLVDITASSTAEQRQLIRRYYLSTTNRDLLDDLKEDLSGDLKHLIVSLYQYPYEFTAEELYRAMKGAGTDETTLNDILITRSSKELKDAKKYFDNKYDKSLEDSISQDTDGTYKKELLKLLEGGRNTNNNVNEEDCKNLANKLSKYKDKEADPNVYSEMLLKRSFAEIKKIAENYEAISGRKLTKAIDKNFFHDVNGLYKDIVNYSMNPSAYFAKRIKDAIYRFGTNEKELTRAFVYRGENDLKQIAKEYQNLYRKDMLKDIKGDTSGHYRRLLEALYNKVQ